MLIVFSARLDAMGEWVAPRVKMVIEYQPHRKLSVETFCAVLELTKIHGLVDFSEIPAEGAKILHGATTSRVSLLYGNTL